MTWSNNNIDTVRKFGCDPEFDVRSLELPEQHAVPEADPSYQFEPGVTEAILLGFMENRRVFLHGPHGSGKSSHIEQVAARLNWPCLRINLDGHVSRSDLIGRDSIVIEDGKQITQFKLGPLAWAIQNPVALIIDEYDAGRPDVMFVLQRVLETEGKLTLPEENQVIEPHPFFRIFATANTLGMGDASGQYIGTQPLNQAQLDRWHLVTELSFLEPAAEAALIKKKIAAMGMSIEAADVDRMAQLARLTRTAFQQGDLSSFLSLRALLNWAENSVHMQDMARAFTVSYFNRCDHPERPTLAEFYQRCFGVGLGGDSGSTEEVF